MIPLLLAALLGLAALLVVIQPLLTASRDGSSRATGATPLADSIEREQTAKQALLDVELDYRLGNLEAGDYSELRGRYEERALAALKARYDAERALDEEIDRQLVRLRARREGKQEVMAAEGSKASLASAAMTSVSHTARPASASRRPNSVRARRRRGA